LGQTKETTNPETAINLFLEREFPQLLKCQTDPHEAFLVPDSFVYGGIAEKVITIIIQPWHSTVTTVIQIVFYITFLVH